MITADSTTTSRDQGLESRRSLARILAVLLFAALTAGGARLAVPLPGIAVPFTLQVFGVLLAGICLGPRLGAYSQLAYLAAGMAGLPVFAAGGGAAYLLGPTGGYLLAFPVAAAIAGAATVRSSRAAAMTAGALLGLAFIHLAGLSWLYVLGMGMPAASGLMPFLPGDVLKLALVVLVGSRLRGPLRRALR
ncbi:MAG: biotin transporter BioY [Gemmatimonadota bacterium]|nr:MAG: biotin transporter BioY [Gemmatimonadota bacterium]